MKRLAAVVLLFCAGCMNSGAETALSKTDSIQNLAWIAGSWEGMRGNRHFEEHWTAPSGKTMLGMSRTVMDGKTIAFEFLRIEERNDGLYYVAQPNGRPPVDFRLSESRQGAVMFVNPGHSDHVKSIHYSRQAEELTAIVEGADEGKNFTQEFHFRAMKASN